MGCTQAVPNGKYWRRLLIGASVSMALLIALASGRAWAETAQEILDAAGVRGGLVVHIGAGDGSLTAALRANESYVVHGLERDPAQAAKARRFIWSKGLYGPVTIDLFDGEHLPYADNLVNLVVSERLGDVTAEEVLRVLAPGGAAYVKQDGRWSKTVKAWPEDIDQWTHHCHGPDGNPVARDRVAGPPAQFQWIAGPKWSRAHDTDSSLSALVSAGGRIFYMVDDAPISLPGDNGLPDEWSLAARDAFNGVLLWKVPVKNWGWRQWKNTWYASRADNFPVNLNRRVVAAGDKVYATLGYHAPVSQLDAATGRILQTYEGTRGAREILYQDGRLLVTVPGEAGIGLTVLDPASGAVIWKTPPVYAGTTRESVRMKVPLDAVLNAAADDRIVCLMDGKKLVCLDRRTGEARWRAVLESKGPALWAGTLIVSGPVVLYAEPGTLTALAAEDGRTLWTQPAGTYGGLWFSWKDVFVIGDLVWTWSAERKGRNPAAVDGYDLRTGERKKHISVGNIFNVDHHHRCYRNKATLRYIIASRRGAEYVDLVEGNHSVHNWVRGVCHLGMMPANGLLYAPPHPCKCYIDEKLSGFCALGPQPAGASKRTPGSSERVERGVAYGKAEGPDAGPEDWPTFRAAPDRSGSNAAHPPTRLDLRWSARVGGRLTAPVAACGKLFAASIDTHAVHALDADSGEPLWRFIAGGRVDSPPTYYKGMVLFGSADGRVTCLRAADGSLVWRFLAAPQERLIGAFGQLESAWPASGAVLVYGGVAYVAAGRSSYLDGGIHLYGLDPATGRVLCRAVIEGPQVDLSDEDWYAAYRAAHGLGALADVLQAADNFICMGDRVFDRRLRGAAEHPARVRALGGMLDDTQFRRAFWFYDREMTADLYEHLTYRPIETLQIRDGMSNLLVHDRQSLYGIRRFDNTKLLDARNYFAPGRGDLLFATAKGAQERTWSRRLPIHVRSLLAASGRLAVAGSPDAGVDREDPLGAFEGRKGGVLWTLSAVTGEKLAERRLASPPVFNGAAAAGDKIFIALTDGDIVCLAPSPEQLNQ